MMIFNKNTAHVCQHMVMRMDTKVWFMDVYENRPQKGKNLHFSASFYDRSITLYTIQPISPHLTSQNLSVEPTLVDVLRIHITNSETPYPILW